MRWVPNAANLVVPPAPADYVLVCRHPWPVVQGTFGIGTTVALRLPRHPALDAAVARDAGASPGIIQSGA